MKVQLIQADLLDQDVDVIVNAWNRNIIPWWLLLPGRLGSDQAAWRHWPVQGIPRPDPPGRCCADFGGPTAVQGHHPRRRNQHALAGIRSIRDCVRNAMALAHEKGFQSIAFPLIGAGSGGFNQERARAIMEDELGKLDFPMEVRVVVYERA